MRAARRRAGRGAGRRGARISGRRARCRHESAPPDDRTGVGRPVPERQVEDGVGPRPGGARVGLTGTVRLLNLGGNRSVTTRAPDGCAADSGVVRRTSLALPGCTCSALHASGTTSASPPSVCSRPSCRGERLPAGGPLRRRRGRGSMSDALVIVLIGALLVALAAVVVLARRRPAPGRAMDEEAIRRLLQDAVGRPRREPSRRSREPDLGRFALLSHEAAAAAEAADAVRRTAAEAADELRTAVPVRGRADPSRRARRGRAVIASARAQAADALSGLDAERNRITVEATAALAEDRKELQAAEQKLRAATQALRRRAAGAGRRPAPDRRRPERAGADEAVAAGQGGGAGGARRRAGRPRVRAGRARARARRRRRRARGRAEPRSPGSPPRPRGPSCWPRRRSPCAATRP